ncbi:MAG: GTPase HflX [Elusimicrobia bacterium]|nr:GTPase HflX [Elusimicrobiota bacterium]
MEKVLLVGTQFPAQERREVEASLAELESLVATAGGTVAEKVVQRRSRYDPATLIGRGKVEELRHTANALGVRSWVFDDELRPVQQRNLEAIAQVKIVDRTRLILDIFARRARSREGILQVELAQLEYFLPRLTGLGTTLDGQVGGIGTRGPGERKLEYDRRRIRQRIGRLHTAIAKIREHRERARAGREATRIPTMAIVGYTNAGKSSLLNALVGQPVVHTDDRLFATLDPTTRRVRLPSGRVILLTDTVGFIRKLPHQLVAAFRATLEEVTHAEAVLHIVDAANPAYEVQMATVWNVLEELGVSEIPQLVVYNKIDLLPSQVLHALERHGALLISATRRLGVDHLLQRLDELTSDLLSHSTAHLMPHAGQALRPFDSAQGRLRSGQAA